jgi:ubiquinone/menaquinone biosynthesis C-methylase UbiE
MEDAARVATESGVKVNISDLQKKFPYDSNSMDVVHANQVIEHVPDLDHFMSEIHRVLKPGGITVISTENGSSWCNIFASIMGWQIFSLTNFSSRASGIGNPFAIYRGDVGQVDSWTHKTIFNYSGLVEYFSVFGFDKVSAKGAGYFPLPAMLGRIDPRHSHFITVCARKNYNMSKPI